MLVKLRILAHSLDDAQQARDYLLRTLGDHIELVPPKPGSDTVFLVYGSLHLPDVDAAVGWALDLPRATVVRR